VSVGELAWIHEESMEQTARDDISAGYLVGYHRLAGAAHMRMQNTN
jgi:hypothetical protein